jgi:hypothetical protein
LNIVSVIWRCPEKLQQGEVLKKPWVERCVEVMFDGRCDSQMVHTSNPCSGERLIGCSDCGKEDVARGASGRVCPLQTLDDQRDPCASAGNASPCWLSSCWVGALCDCGNIAAWNVRRWHRNNSKG